MLDSESRLQEAIQKMLADRQSQTRPMETPDKKMQKNMPEMKDGEKMQNMDQQQENDQHDQDMQM
jgi:hypothetical protein